MTGGGYGSSEGCRPYNTSAECGSPCADAYYQIQPTPVCRRDCENDGSYEKGKHFGSLVKLVKSMRQERRACFAGRQAYMVGERWTDEMGVIPQKEDNGFGWLLFHPGTSPSIASFLCRDGHPNDAERIAAQRSA